VGDVIAFIVLVAAIMWIILDADRYNREHDRDINGRPK
jgi:hypothetical protein